MRRLRIVQVTGRRSRNRDGQISEDDQQRDYDLQALMLHDSGQSIPLYASPQTHPPNNG
jgi:hypothetical protein